MFLADLFAFTVHNDPDMASKFENGVAPPGTHILGHRFSAVASIVAALAGAVSAIASRVTVAVVLVLVACIPLGLLSLVVLQLAF